jgi:predicted PurR-regulated permease PerM
MDRSWGVKLEKWVIWGVLIGILFLLRHMFSIFFLTFVLSYIGNTAVQAMTRRFPKRKLNVAIVYLFFLAVITLLALLVVPRMLNEARNLVRMYITTEAQREAIGAATGATTSDENIIQREAHEFVDTVIIAVAGPEIFEDFRTSDAYLMILARVNRSLATTSERVAAAVTIFANQAILFAFHFLISIIVSFLLVWDLPKTKERMGRFAYGRTAEIYAEIAPGIIAFGTMLGRAFEAQSVVAVVNAVLSMIVFILLGLPSIALLVMIVFVCSYIPILGMIISTIPAAFLSFKLGGLPHVLWLVAAIMIIHAIEAYMLNPLIYGRHLRLHPVAVLVILIVAEHLFGVWGLLLGVPISAFVLKYVIEGEDVKVAPAPAV